MICPNCSKSVLRTLWSMESGERVGYACPRCRRYFTCREVPEPSVTMPSRQEPSIGFHFTQPPSRSTRSAPSMGELRYGRHFHTGDAGKLSRSRNAKERRMRE